MNNKTLGFILLIVGLVLSVVTLIFIPLPAVGIYLLLGIYKPSMSNVVRIIVAFVSAFVVVMAIAFLLS